MSFVRVGRRLAGALLTAMLGAVLGAVLLRLAPGFGLDERELDMRYQDDTRQRVRESRAGGSGMARYAAAYVAGALRGDLGTSETLDRPVADLLRERIPVTAGTVGRGLLLAWGAALALALPGLYGGWRLWRMAAAAACGAALSVPAGVVALLLLLLGGRPEWAVGIIVLPRVHRYLGALLATAAAAPHILTARAKGVGPVRLLLWHVFPPALSPLLALAGISISMALGAAIPVEVFCDSPGVGQLAWKGALGRDLPVLVSLTFLVTSVTLAANSFSDTAAVRHA